MSSHRKKPPRRLTNLDLRASETTLSASAVPVRTAESSRPWPRRMASTAASMARQSHFRHSFVLKIFVLSRRWLKEAESIFIRPAIEDSIIASIVARMHSFAGGASRCAQGSSDALRRWTRSTTLRETACLFFLASLSGKNAAASWVRARLASCASHASPLPFAGKSAVSLTSASRSLWSLRPDQTLPAAAAWSLSGSSASQRS
mmetsp:Transcript_22016/g.74645  ORF Transcript_22016/g.74645 Transcript_22016/m.74645 type:complete len:204 (+) Transcript_22016:93-704(+)